ncbi:MAG: XTP/dITP diphosphatase [Nitrospirae bacterium]|nr:XTP/dITP diphosphatase [Nitrospirota bacterium]
MFNIQYQLISSGETTGKVPGWKFAKREITVRIILATKNKKKVEELTRMFAGRAITFETLDAFPGCPDVIEDGRTFRQNAAKKAVAIARYTGCPALADDSGLEVDALGGAPGVYSARYAGKDANDRNNVKKLLKNMKDISDPNKRTARFVCCLALALPDGRCKTFSGHVRGTIGRRARGFSGFGYDPVFCPLGHDRTFAEMTADEKDGLSHRGRAIGKFYVYLKRVLD